MWTLINTMEIENNISLKPYNTFHIEAIAKHFAKAGNVAEIKELLEDSEKKNEKILVLGGGSNILFRGNFEGLVIKNELKGIELVKADSDHIYIKAQAGENWHQFVMHCINNDYAGAENLSLIPGNVGASPMQNIGAYGVEVKEIFHQLEAYHIKEKKLITFSQTDCEFGYRESVFKKKYRDEFVILNVTYKLNKTPTFNISYKALEEELERRNISQLSIKAISDAVIHIRQSKLPDPEEIGNAGSFFKNPEISRQHYELLKSKHPEVPSYKLTDDLYKVPAAWLIEQCGWKGYRKGDAGCHIKQPLVLVNYDKASGKEIYDLSSDILESVKEMFGIELSREVNVI